MSWGEAYAVALERMVGSKASSRRYQARCKARIAQGCHPSVYPERVGFRFARLFSQGV